MGDTPSAGASGLRVRETQGSVVWEEQEEPPPVPSEPFGCSFKDLQRRVQPEDSHTHDQETDASPDTEKGKTQKSRTFPLEELSTGSPSI